MEKNERTEEEKARSLPDGSAPGEISLAEKAADTELNLHAVRIGRDWTMILAGGHAPHIGCAVLAVPRESLRGDGKMSSTASVLNVTGHKDEEICRYLAERFSAAAGRIVVCTGGVHLDGITSDQIKDVMKAVERMTDQLIKMAELQADESWNGKEG